MADQDDGQDGDDAALVDLFAALSNGDRLRIVRTLGESRGASVRGMSITEIAREVGITRFGASRHLAVLRDAGIVCTRSEGNRAMSSLVAGTLLPIWDWIDEIEPLPALVSA
ncbi:metalloregulator ArsR/SmtB family transcription factor [Microbacterium betulae]|uniref:Metalloregulator ArsR/SmtB family transcription factor n=1 Tax=Microbacterium betulae TaxID=2981139 RepID=A0AA97I673_9MICO|nr:metalloregulator ArsR/SmtB family transcription factor [Microbacterium sp. AB]WOF23534.1 metalloregulator ArsR/SmtB family transcription factor [Microbacterium sp. AB]